MQPKKQRSRRKELSESQKQINTSLEIIKNKR